MKQDSVISSTANPTVKWLRGLGLRKNRDDEGLFVIEGLRDVAEAHKSGFELHTLVTARDGEYDLTAPRHLRVTPDIMSRIVNRDNAQPVMAVLHQRWAQADVCGRGLWLVLEDIRDPGNLGTIIRTADAVSAAGVLLVG